MHSKFAPSSADRWLNCYGSLHFDVGAIAPEYNEQQRIGSFLHKCCEEHLAKGVDLFTYIDKVFLFQGSDITFTQELYDWCCIYIDFINMNIEEGCRAKYEIKLRFGDYAPGGFGTADCIISNVKEKYIHIIDLKNGQIPVSPVKNPQLLMYALGIVASYPIEKLKDFTFKLSIVQPILNKKGTWEVHIDKLLTFGEKVKHIVKKIESGDDSRVVGDWCTYCHNRTVCKQTLSLAVSVLDNPDAVKIFKNRNVILKVISKIAEDFYSEALKGNILEGYKIVEGKANRKLLPDAEPKLKELYGDDIYKTEISLKTLSNLEKIVGKEEFKNYTYRPQGSPQLVEESDPRPPMSANQDIIDLFVEL